MQTSTTQLSVAPGRPSWCSREIDRLRLSAGDARPLARHLLQTQWAIVDPAPATPSVFSRAVPLWHEFLQPSLVSGFRGLLRGWHTERPDNRYCSFTASPGIEGAFGQTLEFAHHHCDIRDIAGIASSKHSEIPAVDLDRWIQQAWSHVGEMPITEFEPTWASARADLERGRGFITVEQYAWDGRLFLVNSDASHRFATARYLAGRSNRRLSIHCLLKRHEIRPEAVQRLLSRFDVFAVAADFPLSSVFDELAGRYLEATWLWYPLPRPLADPLSHKPQPRALFLPRGERRSRAAARVLRRLGVTDLGAWFIKAVAHQRNTLPANSEP